MSIYIFYQYVLDLLFWVFPDFIYCILCTKYSSKKDRQGDQALQILIDVLGVLTTQDFCSHLIFFRNSFLFKVSYSP